MLWQRVCAWGDIATLCSTFKAQEFSLLHMISAASVAGTVSQIHEKINSEAILNLKAALEEDKNSMECTLGWEYLNDSTKSILHVDLWVMLLWVRNLGAEWQQHNLLEKHPQTSAWCLWQSQLKKHACMRPKPIAQPLSQAYSSVDIRTCATVTIIPQLQFIRRVNAPALNWAFPRAPQEFGH